MRTSVHLLLALATPLDAVTVTAQQPTVGLPSLIFEIPVDSLRDVAIAVYASNRGIIYYNPSTMAALGRELASFFRQHELGHLYYHHVRGNALLAGETAADSLMQSSELQADCYAARTLSPGRKAAPLAAAHRFSRMGSVHTPDHPSGAERAAMIMSCIEGE